jgi:isoleucyl-tRNA synthetase
VSHGVVLGDDGQKMSKSLRNYPDPMFVFDTYGSDAMRWYLLSSSILRGADFSVTESGIRETVRQVILPIWNSWYFLSLYANAAGLSGRERTDQTDVLDRYLLVELGAMVRSVTNHMDAYDLFSACHTIADFLDTLTNWYIRRSRDRFWSGDQDAVDTLHTALSTICRVAAPLLPLTTEHVYRALTGERSVHLTDWPSAEGFPTDEDLMTGMQQARNICSTILSMRKAHGLRVRQPLASALVAQHGTVDLVAPHVDIIRDEVNVKDLELTTDVASHASFDLNVLPKAVGPRLGGETQRVIKAVKSGDWAFHGDRVIAGGIELFPGEFERRLVPAGEGVCAALPGNAGIVVLDTEMTPELEREGLARDLVRLVQQARRDAGFAVSDRIRLTVRASGAWVSALRAHETLVLGETLTVEVSTETVDLDSPVIEVIRA